ncbi:MAG: DMT family transporter [Burkholderiales bacterium]|nr:DMT family transporter [Burkholderiales bacterium]
MSDVRAGVAPSITGTVLVFLSAVGFSIKAILIKKAYAHGVDAATLLALRMLFSAPFFVAMALWPGQARPTVPLTAIDWRNLAVLGFLGYYLASWLDFLGLQYVTAGLERLILFMYPTIVVLLSAWWFRERIRRRHMGALILCYSGIALVFVEQLEHATDSRGMALGGALIFGSAFVYSIYLLGSSRVVHRFGAVQFTAWAMLVACVVSIAQFALTHPLDALRLPMDVYALALTMAIFATVLPALFMSEGLRRVGANHAALVGTIGPVVTLILGALFLGEHVGGVQVAGAALVVAGVLLVSLRPGPAQARP